MPLLARSLIALGALFLTHAAYSAHEHSRLLSLHPGSPPQPGDGGVDSQITSYLPALKAPTATFSLSALPSDITAETLLALFLLTLGIVLSAEPLKPIRWSEWAAEVEHGQHGKNSRYIHKEGDSKRLSTEALGQKLYGGPGVEGYGWLENGRRMGFFDVRAKRKDFAGLMRKEGEKEK